MVLLPEGFGLPPLPYTIGILAAALAVGYGFYSRRPPVENAHVVALGVWMGGGAALHALYQLGALPDSIEPFGGTAAVYVTTAVIVGAGWLLADATIDDTHVPAAIAASGSALFLVLVGWVIAVGRRSGTLELLWPALGVIGSLVLSGVVWLAIRQLSPRAATVTGSVGLLVVFGHVLDAVSTTVGVDLLGFGERTPLSQHILLFAEGLPTEPYIGTGWLFVLVKVLLVGIIIALMTEYMEEEPAEGRLLLGFIAAVGLGPGVHNLLLFVAGGGV